MNDLVSIIMPIKNESDFIFQCINSIQQQSFTNWELVAVDDHSTDSSRRLVEEIAKGDGRIRVYSNNGTGIIPALRLALKQASGQYITRMDADDLMPPDRLRPMVEAIFEEPKCVVTGLVKYFSDQPISEGYEKYELWLNDRIGKKDHWNWVYRECVIASPNWLMRTEDLRKIGGFNDIGYPEDYDLVLKWYSNGFQVISLDKITLHWREHPNRISRNSDHYNQEAFFRLKINHFVEYHLKNHKELVLWGALHKGKLTAHILKEMGVPFTWMSENHHSRKLLGEDVLKVDLSSVGKPYRLLISVFPNQAVQSDIKKYLDQFDLKMGEDYWYL